MTPDDLRMEAELAHLHPAELRKLVRERYGVTDLGELSNAQAAELADQLRERADGVRWDS